MSYTYTFVCFTNRIYYGNLLLNDEYKSWPKKSVFFFLLKACEHLILTYAHEPCHEEWNLHSLSLIQNTNKNIAYHGGVRTTHNSSIVYWNLRIWRENKKTTEKNRHPCLWQRDQFSAIKKLINIPNVQRSVKTSENSF